MAKLKKIKRFFLEPKVLLLLFFVLISFYIIFAGKNPFEEKGLLITQVKGSPCVYSKIETPYVLTKICFNEKNCIIPKTMQDLFAFENKTGWISLYTNKGKKTFLFENQLNCTLSFKKPKRHNLEFGLDIVGGIRAIVTLENKTNQTNETLKRVISVLQTRINAFGLKQASFRIINTGKEQGILITIAGGNKDDLLNLINKTGVFEASIFLNLSEGETLKLCKHTTGKEQIFTLKLINSSVVSFGGKTYKIGKRYIICKLPFEIRQIKDNKASIEFFVFDNDDIISLNYDPAYTRFYKSKDGWHFQFGIILSSDGAKRFADVTENLKIIGEHLNQKINLYLDNKLIDSLGIDKDLKGRELTTPVITGFGKTKEEALSSKRTLEAVLRSGALPVKVKIESIDKIDPRVGEEYLKIAGIAGILAILLVSFIVFLRYRNPLLSLGIIGTMLSEIIIILGFAALTKWNLSISALAGIIAAIGFGVDDQIIIVDETLSQRKKEEKVYSIFQALKIAFFMIFASAATTILAMLPIMGLGLSIYRELTGFALTTIIGVLIGVLITRPAFGKYVEYVLK